MIDKTPTKNSTPTWLLILAMLAVLITAVPAIFTYPVERVLLNPAIYKSVLLEQGVYTRYPEVIADIFARYGEAVLPGSEEMLRETLGSSGYQEAILQIFPPSWAREQMESLVDQLLAYLNLQDRELALAVDFRPVKQRLRGEEGAAVAQKVIRGFPPCTADELLAFGVNILQGQLAQVPLCRPPDQFLGVISGVVQRLLSTSATSIPDQANFARILRLPLLFGGQRMETMLGGGFRFYAFYRAVNPWLPLTALLLLVLTAVLARGSHLGTFFWSGLALVLPGGIGLGISLLTAWFSHQSVAATLDRIFPPGLLLAKLLLAVVDQVLAQFAIATLWISLALILLGLLLFVLAIWQRYSRERAQLLR